MSTTSDYYVGKMIGEGSYGCVVHANHKETKRDVAIKVVDKLSLKKHPQVLQSILTEKKLLSMLDSRYVVKLLASFHDEECIYLVMECCIGGDLTHLIQQAGIGTSAAATRRTDADTRRRQYYESIPQYSLQLVNALEYIHSQGICHGDLKPDNILVTQHGCLQLADFGCALYLGSCSTGDEEQSSTGTMILGTVDYASPEILKGNLLCNNVTVGVDLWSFGCVLYAMWRGMSPFHADSDTLAMESILAYCRSKMKTSSNNGALSSGKEELPDFLRDIENLDWQILIRDLLKVNPMGRRGVSDAVAIISNNNTTSSRISYTSIRSSNVWKGVDLSCNPKYLPPSPLWRPKQTASTSSNKNHNDSGNHIEDNNYSMKDGAQGW
eukprot:CAMPEP_0195293470 /NCGR_PEP_ID=MMETSP0707-20130614/12512_1 /TAXON_ID=33640 /ORGANISM="Asterionellopsis glacialis, Strain CCMP134" /LENGTH=381 /DNA_ID=CAMNT_0040354189 /DNA_START=233 /DNA_END=1375 /DNA_ORIENTATION=-